MANAMFPPEARGFLKALAENNNRDFFTEHREQYDRAIRAPLEELLAIAEGEYGPGKIMRANRDIRFSVDKSPYHLDASVWAGTVGGVYLRFSADGIQAGGGLHEPSRDQLERSRAAIAHKPTAASALKTILDRLRSAGYEDASPHLKTAPKGFDRDDPNIELLRLKHYALVEPLPVTATKADIERAWSRIRPLNDWAAEHVGPAVSWP